MRYGLLMIVIGIQALGLAPFPVLGGDLPGRVARVGGPAEGRIAFFDALDLFFSSFDRARLSSFLSRRGFQEEGSPAEIVGDVFPEQAAWTKPDGSRALLHDENSRNIRVRVSFSLDPLQFRSLRDHSRRDANLVNALSEGTTFELTVGWLFNRALTAVSIGPIRLGIGTATIPTSGTDRPFWLDEFLLDLPARFHLGTPASTQAVARAWLDALTSTHPTRHRAAHLLTAALAGEPFNLPDVRPVLWNGVRPVVVVGSALRPIWTLGPQAEEAVTLASAVHLWGAEVIALEDPGARFASREPVTRWLAERAEERNGSIEQVLIGSSTAYDLDPTQPADAPEAAPARDDMR